MPESCCCFGCFNVRQKGSGLSFHKFPLQNPELVNKWLIKISRENFSPSQHHVVCSDHFIKDDYIRGIHPSEDPTSRHDILHQAIPSVFPAHPINKQVILQKRRAPPKLRIKSEKEENPIPI
ncbi:hypothetical protein SNE40_004693 [Patella caerulea]|uniref:THAP-type domain-containing protein n=1 Tax=Patella caerulea TaxID=87958 RepID=A0AAN8KA25_PATCE